MSITKKTKRITSSRGYGEARESFRLTNIGNQYGKGVKKVVSEEQKIKHSQVMKGRYSGEKNPFYGKTHSDETREKLRKSREGMVNEKIWSYKGEKVVIKNNEVVGIFKSSKEIANLIGCSHSNVRRVLSGKQKTTKGYQIKYLNEYHNE
jgi:hypothetical protein